MDKHTIAKRLRELRGDIPRKVLADKLGIATSTVGMYENAQRIPKDDIKKSYSLYFDKSVEEIFFK